MPGPNPEPPEPLGDKSPDEHLQDQLGSWPKDHLTAMAREERRRAEIGAAVLAQVNEDGFSKRPLDADGWQMICPICTGSPASGHSDNCPFPLGGGNQ